ncbi:methyltransferase domain-containing protein [Synechococcus sp. A10-1-5-9]|uniref:methyltransferase domain-containing protein n=1 Tax=Synechococcus sp. A10-1-5-9 TaxID=3392295 RepID=UPI0039EA8766
MSAKAYDKANVAVLRMAVEKSYYDHANPGLLSRIPTSCATVLEVGCGSGALGHAYKMINPSAQYLGIELMETPAKLAKERLDQVWCIDVEDMKIQFELPERYHSIDALVYGDVLEHLKDPQKILREHVSWLSPDGVVVACIPNVQHWSVLYNLIQGNWPQDDTGIFDKTHLRWFTRNSIVELFASLGLKITSFQPRIFNLEQAKKFANILEPCLEKMGQTPQKFLEGSAPLQYIVTATKKLIKPVYISGLMLKPQAGMNEVRMIQPLKSVASFPGVNIELSSTGLQLRSLDPSVPKIMIWQRQTLTYESSLTQLKKIIKAGYILISEFDDDPDHFQSIIDNKYLSFRAVHAVQVSTDSLSSSMKKYNPEVKVFKNCLDFLPASKLGKWIVKSSNPRLRVFFGALNREADWEAWLPCINDLLLEHEDLFEFEVVHDKKFFHSLMTNNKRFTPICDYAKYRQLLSDSHVALMPLRDTKFNKMKSDLKFVEASGYEVASIASPTVYAEVIEPGFNGEIAVDGKRVAEILKLWGECPDLAKACASNARNWIRSNRLQSQQSVARLEWYKDLYQRRDELTKALLQRVPELTLE